MKSGKLAAWAFCEHTVSNLKQTPVYLPHLLSTENLEVERPELDGFYQLQI